MRGPGRHGTPRRRRLAVVEQLIGRGLLDGCPQLHAVRGDLLSKLGRMDQKRQMVERAAGLTHDARERTLFLARATELPCSAG